MQLSVAIITYNEEKNIGRCLASLAGIADEIVVVDSNSADNTGAIAERYGAKVIQKAFAGYAAQKNYAAACTSFDWVLSLDADEELTEELRQSLLAIKQKQEFDAYYLKRVTNFCGKWIRHGGWYPDRQCRLWNKTRGQWQGVIHETWRLSANGSYGLLHGDLYHYSFDTIADYMHMVNKYSELSATEAVAKGKKCSLLKLMVAPGFKFLVDYCFRLGFLDGYQGFIACKLSAMGAFIKYAKIRERYRQQGAL